MAERLMAADCKSAAPCVLRRFESFSLHQYPVVGVRLQAVERWAQYPQIRIDYFLPSAEARTTLRFGGSNSVVESQPSKLLVAGSIPVSRSMIRPT